jgi:RNA polymerase sigma-70 factor (ECF subfamily)
MFSGVSRSLIKNLLRTCLEDRPCASDARNRRIGFKHLGGLVPLFFQRRAKRLLGPGNQAMTGNQQEIRWVVRAQSGDAEALDALLQSVQEPLYRYILRLVGDHHLTCDVLQDVFLLIIRKLYWLRAPGVFRPWAYRIASRQAFQCLKRQRRLSGHQDDALLDAVADESPDLAIDPDILQCLQAMLKDLSPASRAVLSLHYLEEMTIQEVADVLEISLAAAKSRLAYGLAILRRRLQSSNK